MLLRSFEAHGFKSFAEKIEMEFGQGITAIVGPNGSGKSNISDAIRWVLGEQSIRNLRGAKTEDVIFAGSSNRRPLGVAEVLLKFDNSDGALPLDFNEVTISRRVFRSGESEYFINKSPCRLKDIHELFSGTGLGRDSMAVIGQNKVDDVLNNKAEERRLLFEEAAGISKYKQRKKDALRKLADTEQNLTRVLDITSELENQLEPLKESAVRTKQYNELYRELTAYQVTLLVNKLSKAEKMVESAQLEQTSLTDEDITVNTRLSVAETEREKSTIQMADIDENLLAAEQLINTYITELERIEGKIALLNERILQSKTSEERLFTEINQLTQKSDGLKDKIAKITLALREKKRQQQEYNEFLEGKSQEYQKTADSVQRIEKLLAEGQEKTFGHLQDIVDERNNLRTLERDITTLGARIQRLEHEYADNQEQIEASRQRATLITAAQNNLVQAMQQCGEKTDTLHKEKRELEQDLMRSLNEEKKITNKVNELMSRLKILSGMQQEYEGFGRGIKNILKSNAPWRTKICGAVAEVLHVPDKYVTAVEIALGGALQHIITEDDETAKKAIQYLKTQNLGRVTFLPLNTIKPRMPHAQEFEAVKAQGAIGFAADLVECEPDYRKAIEFLLGRTIVAENIDVALQIAKKAAFSVKIVTLEGELINPGGSLTGGSTQRREASFLGRSNEIQMTKALIDDTKIKAESVTKIVFKLKSGVEDINQALESVQQDKQAAEVRQAEFAGQAERVHADINRLSFTMKTIEDELALSSGERTQLEERLLNSKNKIINLENLDIEHKNQVTTWQDELKKLQLQKESLNDEITTIKINGTAVAQEVNANLASCHQYEQEKTVIDGQVLQLTQELQNVKSQGAAALAEIDTVTNLRTETQKMKANAEQRRSTAYNEKMSILSSVQVLDKEIKELRRRGNEVQSKLHEMQLMFTKYSYEVTNCHEQLKDYFAISIEQAKEMHREGTVEQLAQFAEKFEQEIALLGPVNPAAIEEYDRVLERYNFLKQQFEDLISAKDYLSDIIKDIDSTMSKQFKAAFEQINEYFCDIFARLFGGGKAQLVLLEPQDMLNTGIDIVVQPPGKKQQNLMLLSGGERALTVIALLFAFLTYRPAPFCMVDEIDAPLDEANLQRFSQFLRDYSQKTQFIVVTHRKATMEAADVMHGVTMEESGISKLVSVKFVDKAG